MSKNCVIKNCEEKAYGYYPLCKQHLEMTKTGEVYKNNDGNWVEKEILEDINLPEIKINSNCILCGEPTTNGYKYCKDCYYNIQDRMEELDKNQNPTKLKDYYYNAKDYAMRIYNEDKIYYQELTMIAITNLLNQLYNDDSLSERLYKDIQKIEENLKNKNIKLNNSVKETSKIDEIKDNKNKEQGQKETPEESEEENKEKKIEENNVVIINNENKARCITCGKKTDGLLFCSNCYHKYQNKELLFKITNCSNVELLDESYEGRYTCKDGHIVKSKSERDIDNYLFEAGIAHAYEKELSYGASDKEVLHPDFFLLDYLGKGKHVYIEHWGYEENNIQYTQTKKFKMPIYKKLGITLINTYEKTDAKDIDSALARKIKKENIKEGQINYEEK